MEEGDRISYQVIDEANFTNLFNCYWKKLYLICLRQVVDEDKAKDMVQDIYRSLWENRDKIRIRGNIEHYLVRAAKNKVCEYFQRKAIQEQNKQQLIHSSSVSISATEQDVAFNELSFHLETMVSNLSHQRRQVYNMSREEGLRNREIADRLCISEKTVSYHLSSAKEILQQKIAQLYEV
ncbi:MAG: RNA polymerase sigma-70 factor [Chitinophagaceae bacterium]|nr:RNA polymerase sigma-70 factor [Chitinophagaceae bacterium]